MKALLLGRGRLGVEGAQLEGFEMYEREIRHALGLTTERVDTQSLDEVRRHLDNARADIVMVMVSFRDKPADVVELFRRVYERQHRPKLVFLDYFAQTSTPYFPVMPYVDRYLKRQILRDRSLYQNTYRGGFIFTDYLATKLGYDIGTWSFGSMLPREHEHKLLAGWSLVVTNRFRQLLRANRLLPKRWRKRNIELNCRVKPPEIQPWEWYQEYRAASQKQADALRGRYRTSGTARISRWKFMLEMRDSKIVFSPFGWGEVCFRDYEAVVWGSLLVKPSMAHVETYPDIFTEDAYVPLQWDNADLDEKCAYWLARPDEAEAMVKTSQERLTEYFEAGGFVQNVRRLLDGM